MSVRFKRTIWLKESNPQTVCIIDQRRLPHEFVASELNSYTHAITAIQDMAVRGAPLIGATGAMGLYLALLKDVKSPEDLVRVAGEIRNARPTAVNLQWAVDRLLRALEDVPLGDATEVAKQEALALIEEDVEICRMIGVHGLELIEEIAERKQGPVNILTHCNAGSLATIEWGTATSPIYHAHKKGMDVHVWVDETRPRNQGAALTAFELGEHGVPHTIIVDNAGGHLMQQGKVDLVFVGTDRTARSGDVANKIGTYLKALAAKDCDVPFYVCLPSPTIDWECTDGLTQIPIEERSGEEVSLVYGATESETRLVRVTPQGSPVANPAFDVTPARLVAGLITERGICTASEDGLLSLFPEHR